MDNPIIILVIAVTAVWVYWDATKHQIGKTDAGGMFNISAGAWGACTLLLWIIAFPAYLIKRNELKAIAQEQPATVKLRGLKISIIALIGFVWFVSVAYAQYLQQFSQ